MTGQEALHWRQLAIRNDENEVKKQFNESIRAYMPDGVQADFNHFLGIVGLRIQPMAIVNVSGNMGTATGKHVFLPGFFFEVARQTSICRAGQANRSDRCPLSARWSSDEVTYHLPAGSRSRAHRSPRASPGPTTPSSRSTPRRSGTSRRNDRERWRTTSPCSTRTNTAICTTSIRRSPQQINSNSCSTRAQAAKGN